MEKWDVELEEVKECPICGEKEGIQKEFFMNKHMGIVLVWNKCLRCTTVYQSPRMTDKSADVYYFSAYRELMFKSAEPVEKEIKYEQFRANIQNKIIQDYLTKNSVRPFSILDVGAALGFLSENLKAVYGCETYAVDPCRSYTFHNKADHRYEKLSQVVGKFDLVICSHTLEHINHPREFLEEIVSHTHEGSILFIDVPNGVSTRNAYLFHHPVAYDFMNLSTLLGNMRLLAKYSLQYHGMGIPINTNITLTITV
jgi:SAM-dependent methyltransferase